MFFSQPIRWKRRCSRGIAALVILYSGICLYFWIVQTEKIFDPMSDILTTPDRMGMGYERVSIPVGEGSERKELDGFWVPAEGPDPPTFLYLHGQDATIGKNLDHTLRLHRMGYSVLVVDYRGFGKSFGEERLSETSVYEDSEIMVRSGLYQPGASPEVDTAVALYPALDAFAAGRAQNGFDEAFNALAQSLSPVQEGVG